jgi:hypothetical protein
VNGNDLILHFAYEPNTKGMCGKNMPDIYEKRDADILPFVKTLKTLYAFLDATGRVLGKPPLDYEIARSYIIGRDDWNEVNPLLLPRLKENLQKIILPDKKRKLAEMPANLPLNHNFLVFYFGAVTNPLIVNNLEFQDNCKVSLGKVVGKNQVEYNRLLKDYTTSKTAAEIRSPFFPLEEGERVLIHHKTAFWKPEKDEIRTYENNMKLLSRLGDTFL